MSRDRQSKDALVDAIEIDAHDYRLLRLLASTGRGCAVEGRHETAVPATVMQSITFLADAYLMGRKAYWCRPSRSEKQPVC